MYRKIIQISVLTSFILLVFSSIIIVFPNFSLLKEAFTGGKYRLGFLEFQANGYASYCVLCSIVLINLYFEYNKPCYLLALGIPSIICFGTQSKKGILLCFLLFTYAFILFTRSLSKKRTRIITIVIYFAFVLFLIGFLVFKTNTLSRLFNLSDLSNFERITMINYSLRGNTDSLLIGNGLNSFPSFFELNYGSNVILHSTFFDLLFSGGLIAIALWICFYFFMIKKYLLAESQTRWFCIVFCAVQFLLDLTSQIWYLPLNFVVFALIFFPYNQVKNDTVSKIGFYQVNI